MSLGLQLVPADWFGPPIYGQEKPSKTSVPIAGSSVVGITAEDIETDFQKALKGVSDLQLEQILLNPSYPFIPWPKTKCGRTELESFLAICIMVILYSEIFFVSTKT